MYKSSFSELSTKNRWIIVCGHALFLGKPIGKKLKINNPDQWYGLPPEGDPKKGVELIIEHIRVSMNDLEDDPNSILIFSGCRSRGGQSIEVKMGKKGKKKGKKKEEPKFNGLLRSEAESYFEVAIRLGLSRDLWPRVVIEDVARTTLENVLMGCAAAYEVCQTIPQRVDLITFKEKEDRIEHHIRSLGLGPLNGDAPPRAAGPVFKIKGVGEGYTAGIGSPVGESGTLKKFTIDPLGLESDTSGIRYDSSHQAYRNPFFRQPGRYLAAAKGWPQLHGALKAAYAPEME